MLRDGYTLVIKLSSYNMSPTRFHTENSFTAACLTNNSYQVHPIV